MEHVAFVSTSPLTLPVPLMTRPAATRASLVVRAMRVLPFSEDLCRELANDADSGLEGVVDDLERRASGRVSAGDGGTL